MSEFKHSMKERDAPIYSRMCHPETIHINTLLVLYDCGYWHRQKKTADVEKITWAPNYSRFVYSSEWYAVK